MQLEQFFQYFYSLCYIPIYLYEGETVLHAFPKQTPATYPSPAYYSLLIGSPGTITYTMTSYGSHYGSVKLDENRVILMGPINDFVYTDENLSEIKREFRFNEADTSDFFDFFRNIPPENSDVFVNKLLFINFILNKTELTKKEVLYITGEQTQTSIMEKYVNSGLEKKEAEELYNSFNIEEAIVRFVETGQVEKLREFSKQAQYAKIGDIAPTAIRQWKNLLIVTVTLVSRAAMRGGLSPTIAYHLSNVYMQSVERQSDVESIKALITQAQHDYATRVANTAIPNNVDKVLHEIIQFIRINTNKPLSVEGIAEKFGYSRTSLSRKFKNELNFTLSSFIRETKLDEAKDLLSFTNKNISEISNYLCFSSQSHFQRSFKAYAGITPEKYRKSFWRLNELK